MLESFLNYRKCNFPYSFCVIRTDYTFSGKLFPLKWHRWRTDPRFQSILHAQEGSTYEFNLDYIDDIAKTVTDLVPERDGVISMVRGGGGFVRVTLVNPKERDRTQQQIADELGVALRKKTKARSMVMQQSTFGGQTCRYAYSICSSGNQY